MLSKTRGFLMKLVEKIMVSTWICYFISFIASLIFLIFMVCACTYINRALGIENDGPMEQFIEKQMEDEIEEHVPIDVTIDLTPEGK